MSNIIMKKLFTTLIFTLSLLFISLNATAQYTTLLNFNVTNGARPYGSLISDGMFLYGMTYYGGLSTDSGVVFKIKPNGNNYTKLLDFSGTTGMWPYGSLIYDSTYFYGMTEYGGNSPYPGQGVIFKIKPDGTGYTDLHDFVTTTGWQPKGSLVSDGTYLYGMTYLGGTNNKGTVFKIKPNGTNYTVLLDFNGTNGEQPTGSLILDGNYLYGMAGGGANSDGLIFKIKTNGTGYTDLLDFNGTNGEYPTGSLISDSIYLYGMTSYGGANNLGLIFKIKLNGTGYTDLLDFNGTNGKQPNGSLILDSNFTYLYGMTTAGGANDSGVVFRVKPDGTSYTNLHDFTFPTGISPYGSLFSDGNSLYGMTAFGGANNDGVIFKLGITTDINKYNNADNNFTIYPNPSKGVFAIIKSNATQNAKLIISNALGQTIFCKKIVHNKTIIDLSNQLAGIYLLHIKTKNGSFNKKLIVQ